MSLIKGKLTSFSFAGADVPFKTAKHNIIYSKIEVTDNSSDNIEHKLGRYTGEIELSGVISKSGEKQIGKGLALTFNAVSYKTTALSFEETFQEIDTTHGASSGDSTEHDVSYSERKMTADIWMEDTVADPALNSEQAATLLFATGVSAAGNLILESKAGDDDIKGDVKLSLAGIFNSTVTQTELGLTAGASGTVDMTFADGTVTDKEVTGTAILVSKKISASIDGDVNFTYTFKITGAITEAVKADV